MNAEQQEIPVQFGADFSLIKSNGNTLIQFSGDSEAHLILKREPSPYSQSLILHCPTLKHSIIVSESSYRAALGIPGAQSPAEVSKKESLKRQFQAAKAVSRRSTH